MGRARRNSSNFDPNQCPLLQGLSPEEQQLRMESDPMIRNCIRAFRDRGVYPAECAAAAAARPVMPATLPVERKPGSESAG